MLITESPSCDVSYPPQATNELMWRRQEPTYHEIIDDLVEEARLAHTRPTQQGYLELKVGQDLCDFDGLRLFLDLVQQVLLFSFVAFSVWLRL